ncbi:MAG: chitobiase/beta-hexosaminidase C-terminal domain-containing protein, partial [Oscillospiraceae bacterium]|nr:chitobiase/beta-hexosaminidase C-terminal domain-containing protein [Oscillospiraceae bacterium]
NDYQRSGTNRYGNPTEMQDIIQELTLTQDRSFALTIDKGNDADQGYAKNAGKMLLLQIAERAVPEFDKYVFNRLANKAGFVVGNSTAMTKSNICERISEATVMLDDMEVPAYDRMLFVSTKGYKMLKHSDEFLAIQELGKDSLAKGIVGNYDNMQVIKVPAPRWPENVNFMIVHKNAATAPVKMSETKLHKDPPGISGHLLEGREYYDCFVFAPRAWGVYAEIDTTEGKGTVCEVPEIAANGNITCDTAGAIVFYTVDGSDPRYSATAVQGNTAPVVSGTTVKAYAHKDGAFDSAVAELTV